MRKKMFNMDPKTGQLNNLGAKPSNSDSIDYSL